MSVDFFLLGEEEPGRPTITRVFQLRANIKVKMAAKIPENLDFCVWLVNLSERNLQRVNYVALELQNVHGLSFSMCTLLYDNYFMVSNLLFIRWMNRTVEYSGVF